MQTKRCLSHIPSLSGPKAQESLPRYRKRGEDDNKYVFACRLKKLPHLWLVIHEEFFGIMPSGQFMIEYVTSNDCSREQRELYAHADAVRPETKGKA